MTSKITRRDF